MRIFLWRSTAVLFVIIGLIGVVVPVMPTTVFLLIAAWAAAHGWPELEAWLLDHPRFGPPIRDWRQHRAIPRKAKCAASTTMLISILIIAISPAPNAVKILVPLFLLLVLVWMWLRPEPEQRTERPEPEQKRERPEPEQRTERPEPEQKTRQK